MFFNLLLSLKKASKSIVPLFIKRRARKIVMPFFAKKRLREWDGMPDIVLIENTNLCNAKCVMCPNIKMKRKKDVMSFNLYKKIIDECKTFGIQRIQLAGTGEPLIDPLLFERISYAKKIGIKEVNIFTNASLLNKEKQENLLMSGVDLVHLSIDSFTRETYEKIRCGLFFEEVKENVLSFLRMKKERKYSKPFIVVGGLRVKGYLSDYLKSDFHKEVEKLCDLVWIGKEEDTHNWAGSVEKINSEFSVSYNFPCRRLWASLSVLWDGKVSLCCIDYEGSMILGDVNKQSIIDIWNSKRFNEIRQNHLHLQFNKIALCKNCYERPSWIPKRPERVLTNL